MSAHPRVSFVWPMKNILMEFEKRKLECYVYEVRNFVLQTSLKVIHKVAFKLCGRQRS